MLGVQGRSSGRTTFGNCFEEGQRRQRIIRQPGTSTNNEKACICRNNHEHKEKNITAAHLKNFRVLDTISNFCDLKGHFDKCFNSEQKDNWRRKVNLKQIDKTDKKTTCRRLHRVEYYGEDKDTEEEIMVLNVKNKHKR